MMCTVAYPSSYLSVTPAIVDGTQVTGRGWPAPLDEKVIEPSDVIYGDFSL